MTYLVGWKRGNAAFLCADSAVTRAPNAAVTQPRSSFGEQNVTSPTRTVQEGPLKVVKLKGMAIALAGVAQKGYEIADDVSAQLDAGREPRDAVQRAIDRHRSRTIGVHLLVLISEDPAPCLLAYRDGVLEEVTDDRIVHAGSMGTFYRELTEVTVHTLAREQRFSDEELLVCTLGYLQGWGARDQLMEKYCVGGAFVGIRATTDDVYWQPDMLIALSAAPKWRSGEPPEVVGTVICENVLMISSTFMNVTRYFSNAINVRRPEDWEARWLTPDFNALMDSPFRYVNIVDTQSMSLAVVQMNGQRETLHARLRVRKIADGQRAIALDLARPVYEGLTTSPIVPPLEPGKQFVGVGKFAFFEYHPPRMHWPPVPGTAS